MRTFTMCTLLIFLVGCGAQPTKPATTETPSSNVTPAAATPQPQASTPASVQPAPAASTQAPTAPAGQPASAGEAAEKAPTKPPPGFRVTKIDGKVYYCRSEATIGSKFKEKLCYTQEQLDEIARRADAVMDVVGRGCVGANCGGT